MSWRIVFRPICWFKKHKMVPEYYEFALIKEECSRCGKKKYYMEDN